MKKIFILLILSILLLSGCSSIYNLNNFVLSDDAEFLALIQELSTPQKICQYMADNFTYEAHLGKPLDPYQLYLLKKGDCDDFTNFNRYFSNYHGYVTYQISIYYENYNGHCITIYKENGSYNFSDNQYYFSVNYNTFIEIVELDCFLQNLTWSEYIVYDYDMNIIEQVKK